jgi:hypothetical protein
LCRAQSPDKNGDCRTESGNGKAIVTAIIHGIRYDVIAQKFSPNKFGLFVSKLKIGLALRELNLSAFIYSYHYHLWEVFGAGV